jgi:small subunit ribosomal protein S18
MNTNQKYEFYIIFKSDVSAEVAESKINDYLKSLNAENVQMEREGVRKMAYPIKNNWNGLYYLITFDLALENGALINKNTYRLNTDESVLRYLNSNITELLIQKGKEKLNQNPETRTHRELNKGKQKNKICICTYLGLRELDYKEAEFLEQFTSPYAKIFGRERTGSSAKFQRKITSAIKNARHMALMPFTAKWIEG